MMGDPVHPHPVQRPTRPHHARGALYTVAAGMLFTNLYGEILLLETILQRSELKSWAWTSKGDAYTQRLAPAPILASRLDYAQRALALNLSYDLVNGSPGAY